MFTTGQLIFALLFFISFVVVLAFQYRKDRKLHRRYYKGTVWILIAFIGFIAMLATVKFLFM
jgi:ABC-type transport system involved in cytochrome c biogenesis permease component